MTRAIFGRSASVFASRSIIEAMIRIWYGVMPNVRRLGVDVLLADDALHLPDHPAQRRGPASRRSTPGTCRGTAGPRAT